MMTNESKSSQARRTYLRRIELKEWDPLLKVSFFNYKPGQRRNNVKGIEASICLLRRTGMAEDL